MKFDPEVPQLLRRRQLSRPARLRRRNQRLYHNNCNGTFTDVSEKSGIGAFIGRTMGVTAADFDNDG